MPSRKISDVIRHQKILCAETGTTVRDAACLMAQEKVGSILIVENGLLAGIFTERDVLNRVVAARLDPDTTTLASVMTKNPQTIKPDRPFSHAMHLMYEGCFRHMPVVEDGKLVGIVSVCRWPHFGHLIVEARTDVTRPPPRPSRAARRG